MCELPTSHTWGALLNFQEQHSPHYSEPALTPSSFLQILLVALLKMLLFGPFGRSSSLNFLSIVAFTIYSIAHGAPLFDNSTIPTNLTVSCSNALLSDVNCSPSVMGLQYGNYYPETTLQRVCTSDCDAALAKYEADVTTACAGQSWNGYDDYLMPLAIIPDTIRYQYNLTCLMDSGRYCNIVAAQAAAALDPDGMQIPNLSRLCFPKSRECFGLMYLRQRPSHRWESQCYHTALAMRSLLRRKSKIPSRISILRWPVACFGVFLEDF